MAASTGELRRQQIEQAEELLFSGPQKAGFAKDLFLGKFRAESMFPYPTFSPDERKTGDEAVEAIRTALTNSGLDAVMESSNVQGDLVRARLRVGGVS